MSFCVHGFLFNYLVPLIFLFYFYIEVSVLRNKFVLGHLDPNPIYSILGSTDPDPVKKRDEFCNTEKNKFIQASIEILIFADFK